MAINKTWAERCEEDARPPQPMRIQGANCTIGGNSPTEVMGVIENTPGNTWMNRPLGAVRKSPGAASKTGHSENPWSWISDQSWPEIITSIDRGR